MSNSGKRIVATNRQAKREFEIFDTIEAGMVLQGSEVKSLRNSQAQLAEAFCRIHDGEIMAEFCHISKYDHSSPAFLTNQTDQRNFFYTRGNLQVTGSS